MILVTNKCGQKNWLNWLLMSILIHKQLRYMCLNMNYIGTNNYKQKNWLHCGTGLGRTHYNQMELWLAISGSVCSGVKWVYSIVV